MLSASASRVVATMPVLGNVQPDGLLHGGASCVLAQTIGSLGAFLHAGVSQMVVGIEISATPSATPVHCPGQPLPDPLVGKPVSSGRNGREPFQHSNRYYSQVERPYPWRSDDGAVSLQESRGDPR